MSKINQNKTTFQMIADVDGDIHDIFNTKMPENYFPDNDDTKAPLVTWRSHANLIYQNWLNYFVYQTTPCDSSTITPIK